MKVELNEQDVEHILDMLDYKCKDCFGSGTITNKDGLNYQCSRCFGRGYLLTDIGKEFMKFITRHKGAGYY